MFELQIAFEWLIPIALLIVGFVAGRVAERRHYARIRQDEAENLDLLALTTKRVPAHLQGTTPSLVMGSVVISQDYFKAFHMGLKKLFGGHLPGYETLLDRARREAVIRMKAEARERGAKMIINTRLATSQIGGAQGFVSVEVIAYGTALV